MVSLVEEITVKTRGKGTYEITAQVEDFISEVGNRFRTGHCFSAAHQRESGHHGKRRSIRANRSSFLF